MTATTTPQVTPPAATNGAAKPATPTPVAAPVEATPPAPPPTPEAPKPPAINPELEARYRARERQIVEREQRFSRERQQWEQQQKAYKPLEQEIASDPIAAFARVHGISYDQAEQHVIGRAVNKRQPSLNEELSKRDQRIQQLEQNLQERDQRDAKAAQQQKLEQALVAFHTMASRSTDSHPFASALAEDDPDALREAVLEANNAAYRKFGHTLTDEEALDNIEESLSKRAKTFGRVLSKRPTNDPATSPPGTAATPAAPTLTSGGDAPAPSQNGKSVLRMKPEEILATVRAKAAELKAKRQG